MAWSPGGAELAMVVNDEIVVFDRESETVVNRFPIGGSPVTGLTFAHGGECLVAAVLLGPEPARRSVLRMWSLDDGVLRSSTVQEEILQLRSSPDGSRAISLHQPRPTEPAYLTIWSVDTEGLGQREVVKRSAPVTAAAVSDEMVAFSEGSAVFLVGPDVDAPLASPGFASNGDTICGLALDSDGRFLATAHASGAVRLWDARGSLLSALQGHSRAVTDLAFLSSGTALISCSSLDGSVCVWDPTSKAMLARESVATARNDFVALIRPSLAIHPSHPLVAVNTSYGRATYVYEFDLPSAPSAAAVTYATAKIVLVGEPGAGKTGLGFRLAHGKFVEQASTHGQQFWILDQLRDVRTDGTECEAVLWDLAGQPDYRLIHGLFLDDADLALILVDTTRDDDPLRGVTYWLRQLGNSHRPKTLLVAARIDRGTGRLTATEVEEFCRQNDIFGYVTTSALTGAGLDQLIEAIKKAISWDRFPTTVTTDTFKAIKDHVLTMKEGAGAMVTPGFLAEQLRVSGVAGEATDAEINTAVGHLSHHGYVSVLRSSRGERRLLLAPDLLNNLASSIVLAARANPQGLGSLTEQDVLSAASGFPELTGFEKEEREILLDSAVALFLRHNICYREADPLSGRTYLVFPELINLRRPPIVDERPIEDGTAYTLVGPVQNVYASLVVLLGYTNMFARTNQWRDQARYEVGGGQLCGIRLEDEREGELDLVLFFGTGVAASVRTLFQTLFESLLGGRSLVVRRYVPVICDNGHRLSFAVVRDQLAEGLREAFCSRCGTQVALPDPRLDEEAAPEQAAAQRRSATDRSRFERAVFRLQAYLTQEGHKPLRCFISYAHGDPDHESWVERSLATDLLKVGDTVDLDRWHARFGDNVGRFVESLDRADRVLVVGTPDYQRKNEGHVLAAEYDLVLGRMTGADERKRTVLPLLVAGTPDESLPPLLRGRVYADFRAEGRYFETMFQLMLSLHGLDPANPAVALLLDLVRGVEET